MKIVYITREGYELAGARIRSYNFANELRKCGLDTEVFSFADTLGAKSGKEEHRLKIKEKLKYNIETLKRFRKNKNVIFFLNRLHYHSFAPWLMHILNGNKLIFDLDDWEIREDPRYYFGFWPSSKAEFLTRKIAKSSNLCIAASHFLKDFLEQFNPRVYYIPSGVDTDIFCPKPKVENIDKIVLSWIGTMHRLDNVENLNFLIECFREISRKYKDVILEILGDGIYRNKVIKKVFDKNIIFKGWIAPEKVPEYLANIDIGAMPLTQETKFNFAKSPAKLFEYMAMSKSVICSDRGECSYIIRDGENGFLAKDREEFIKKIKILIHDENLRKILGENANKTIKFNYSMRVLGERLFRAIMTMQK